MQVMLMRLMSKGEYLIVPKGTKFTEVGKLGFKVLIICLVDESIIEKKKNGSRKLCSLKSCMNYWYGVKT